jgi:nitrogen fixation protein FixH
MEFALWAFFGVILVVAILVATNSTTPWRGVVRWVRLGYPTNQRTLVIASVREYELSAIAARDDALALVEVFRKHLTLPRDRPGVKALLAQLPYADAAKLAELASGYATHYEAERVVAARLGAALEHDSVPPDEECIGLYRRILTSIGY